jgi:WD40 repeat protein
MMRNTSVWISVIQTLGEERHMDTIALV